MDDQSKATGLRIIIPLILLGAVTLMVGSFVVQNVDTTMLVVSGVFVFLLLFLHEDAILYGLIFSMLLSPEIMMGKTTSHDIVIRFEDIILLVMAFSWLMKIAINKDPGIFFNAPINWNVNIYLALCALSTTFGMMGGRVEVLSGMMFVLKYVEFYIVYIVVINNIRNKEAIPRYINSMFAVCVIICIFALYRYAQGGAMEAPFEGPGGGEKNTLGGYLVLVFGLALGILTWTRKLYYQIFLFALLVLIYITLSLSLSRGSWLSMLAIFLFAILSARNYRLHFTAAAILSVLAFIVISPQTTKDRVAYTFKEQVTQEEQISIFNYKLDTSTSARLLTFQAALEQFYKHPFLGWGVTGFVFIDSQYFRSLAEIGLLGLFAFLLMLLAIWRTAKALLLTQTGFYQGLVFGFMAAMVGIMVHSVSANTFIIIRIMEPFWFLTAIIMYLHIDEGENRALRDLAGTLKKT